MVEEERELNEKEEPVNELGIIIHYSFLNNI